MILPLFIIDQVSDGGYGSDVYEPFPASHYVSFCEDS